MFKPARIVTVSLLGLLAFLATAIYGDPADELDKTTTTELLKRIERLEARIAILEGRAVVPRFTQPVPGEPARANRGEPKYWSKNKFNGSYYYIVPLHSEQETR